MYKPPKYNIDSSKAKRFLEDNDDNNIEKEANDILKQYEDQDRDSDKGLDKEGKKELALSGLGYSKDKSANRKDRKRDKGK